MRGRGTYSSQELIEVLADDGLYDLSIDICKPNTKVCTDDEQAGEHDDIECFFGLPSW
jgi:hypothetical protein